MKKVTRKEFDALAEKVAHLESMKAEESPKIINKRLPKLDQSIFDGMPEHIKWAAITSEGAVLLFELEPDVKHGSWLWEGDCRQQSLIGRYDASDWKNSLIQREQELTGVNLCRAMLKRGDVYVMCAYDNGYDRHPKAISMDKFECLFYINGDYRHGIAGAGVYPINNQGEPLTAAEAGF